MSKEKMEAILLQRVSDCQDNVHNAYKAYRQAEAELNKAQADLVIWQSVGEEA